MKTIIVAAVVLLALSEPWAMVIVGLTTLLGTVAVAMIGTRRKVDEGNSKLDDVLLGQLALGERISSLQDQLYDHTLQDAERFDELTDRLDALTKP